MEDTCKIHSELIYDLQQDVNHTKLTNDKILKRLDELAIKMDSISKVKIRKQGEHAAGDYYLTDLMLDVTNKLDTISNSIKESEMTKEKVLNIVDKYKIEINDIFQEYKDTLIDEKVNKTNNKLQLILAIGAILSMIISSISMFFTIDK